MPYKNAEDRKKYSDRYNKLHPQKRRDELSAEELEHKRDLARKRYKKNPEQFEVI